jgi:hypothetical protein
MRFPLFLSILCIPSVAGVRLITRIRGFLGRLSSGIPTATNVQPEAHGEDLKPDSDDSNFWGSVFKEISQLINPSPTWKLSDQPKEEIDKQSYGLIPLHTTSGSSIWIASAGANRKVMKVTNNCNALVIVDKSCSNPRSTDDSFPCNSDSIMDEFKIMKTLGDLPNAIVPHADAVSAIELFSEVPSESSLPTRVLGKKVTENIETSDGQSHARWTYCVKINASYRAILEELVGPDYFDHANGESSSPPKIYFQELVMMTRRVVGLMWRLHDFGIIHGDFHAGNAAFKLKDDTIDSTTGRAGVSKYSALTDEMVLIDFDLSRFLKDELGSSDSQEFDFRFNPVLSSHWQLQGKRIGRRDDLARVIESLFEYMTHKSGPKRFSKTLEEASHQETWGKQLADMKSKYSFSSGIDTGKSGYFSFKGNKDALRNLDIALELIRGIVHVDHRPPYEKIIAALDRAMLYSSCKFFSAKETFKLRDSLVEIGNIDAEDLSVGVATLSGRRRDIDTSKLKGNDAILSEYLQDKVVTKRNMFGETNIQGRVRKVCRSVGR